MYTHVYIYIYYRYIHLCAFQTFRPQSRSQPLLYMSLDPKLAWKAGKLESRVGMLGDLKVLDRHDTSSTQKHTEAAR